MAMKTVSITVDESLLTDYVVAECATRGYQATIPDPDHPGQTKVNTQTPEDFAKQWFIRYAVETTKAYQAKLADVHRVAALKAVDDKLAGAPSIEVNIS